MDGWLGGWACWRGSASHPARTAAPPTFPSLPAPLPLLRPLPAAGMLRHMRSLRSMRRDNGWIHTLLEEAENERMHLLTFMQLRQPGIAFRGAVLAGQGIFFNLYLVMYTFFPKTCHSFVGVSATQRWPPPPPSPPPCTAAV